MPRISGVDIPPDKPIRISLRYIYGIGPTNADQILKELAIDGQRPRQGPERRRAGQDHRRDRSFAPRGRRVASEHPAEHRAAARHWSWRGNRHRRSLPVRGQRTRSNARTRKGPRKTVAGKKGVKELGK
jgi:small subunit ribosomal protein S13